MKGFTSTDAKSLQRDVIAGKSAADVKTKTRGRAIVTGGREPPLAQWDFSVESSAMLSMKAIARTTRSVGSAPQGWNTRVALDDAGYGRLGKCLAVAESDGEHWQRILASRAAAMTGCRLR